MAADGSDVVKAAVACYYLEDVCDTEKRVRRPRRFWTRDVIIRIVKELNRSRVKIIFTLVW
jgi:hypothetical protein